MNYKLIYLQQVESKGQNVSTVNRIWLPFKFRSNCLNSSSHSFYSKPSSWYVAVLYPLIHLRLLVWTAEHRINEEKQQQHSQQQQRRWRLLQTKRTHSVYNREQRARRRNGIGKQGAHTHHTYSIVCMCGWFDESERNMFEHRIHWVQLSFLRHRLRLYVIRCSAFVVSASVRNTKQNPYAIVIKTGKCNRHWHCCCFLSTVRCVACSAQIIFRFVFGNCICWIFLAMQ